MLTQMMGVFRRLIKAADGTEAVEFALVAVPLCIFLLGVVEFARIYWTQSELQYAAESSARYVTINSGASPCTSYAATQLLGMSGSLASCSSSTSAACGQSGYADIHLQFDRELAASDQVDHSLGQSLQPDLVIGEY